MRIAIKNNNVKVLEVSSITKKIQFNNCWLVCDEMHFKMSEKEADLLIEEAFSKGSLDLRHLEIS